MQDFKNAGEKLVAARVRMLFKQPFFGNIACRLELVEVEPGGWCPTAAVDGRRFYYNPEFVMKLDMDETVFLVGHEVGHCIYEHFLRRGDRDGKIWNMAGDYKINAMLVREGIGRLITTVKPLYDKKYASDDWWTENVYDDLIQQGAAPQQTIDVHIEVGSGEGDEGKDGKGKNAPTISAAEAKAISDEMKNVIMQAAQAVGAGNVPGDIRRMIGALTAPQMDWRQMIRVSLESNLVSDFTFMRPNRKSQFHDFVLPGMKKISKSMLLLVSTLAVLSATTTSVTSLAKCRALWISSKTTAWMCGASILKSAGMTSLLATTVVRLPNSR